jgi:predicted nucleotidyltransferase
MKRTMVENLERYFAARAASGVVSAYLFGSEAEGRAHRESDVDLGVLLSWAEGSRRERAELRERMIADLVHVLRRNEVDLVILNDAPPELGRAIVTRGLRVFVSDPEADHAYVRDVQLRAADLAPWLRRMRRLKLEFLRR